MQTTLHTTANATTATEFAAKLTAAGYEVVDCYNYESDQWEIGVRSKVNQYSTYWLQFTNAYTLSSGYTIEASCKVTHRYSTKTGRKCSANKTTQAIAARIQAALAG